MDTTTQVMALSCAGRIVAALESHDLKVPAALADAVAVYRECESLDPDSGVDIDGEAPTVKRDDVAGLVRRAVDAEVMRQAFPKGRGAVLNRLGQRAVLALKVAGPEIIDLLAEPFNRTSAAFADVHRELPEGYGDPAVLLAAGSPAVAVWDRALPLASSLSGLARVRDELADRGLMASPSGELEVGTRYAHVRHTAGARRAALVRAGNQLGKWGALLETDGVLGLRWLTIPEQTKYIAGLTVAEDRWEQVENEGFGGLQKKSA
jgi:hypothetical protein